MKYWNNEGALKAEAAELRELIPSLGQVLKPTKNPMLARFRKVSNAYYRLFNDGDANAKLLGVYASQIRNANWSQSVGISNNGWETIGATADEAFETAIRAAYNEQFGQEV